MTNISATSAWTEAEIAAFLGDTQIPLRIAVVDGDAPLICSVWFAYSNGNLICVSHQDSRLAQLLTKAGRCGFEVAPNQPPYHGVRGKARVTVSAADAESQLRKLIEHYLGDTNQKLANWLLGRADDEKVFVLTPTWITSWDYRNRMEVAGRGDTN